MTSFKDISSKKGILFDFDDTLAQTKFGKNFGLKLASLKMYDYLKKKGVDIDCDNLCQKTEKMAQEMDEQKKYDRDFWWSSILQKFLRESPRRSFLRELTKAYWDATGQRSKPYKDTVSTLMYLKKKKYVLGMVSDTDRVKGMKSKRIRSLNLHGWFDAIVVAGENTKQMKPDKAPFLLALQRLHLKPGQCVFVGNNILVDILGAQRAGMATVLIKRDSRKAEIKPDRVIRTLSGLKGIL